MKTTTLASIALLTLVTFASTPAAAEHRYAEQRSLEDALALSFDELARIRQDVDALCSKDGYKHGRHKHHKHKRGDRCDYIQDRLDRLAGYLADVDRAAQRQLRRARRARMPVRPVAMSQPSFSRFLASVHAAHFGSQKRELVAYEVKVSYFTSGQVRAVLDSFTFDSEKRVALELMAPRVVDPQNGYLIFGTFTFESDRRAARRMLSGAGV